MWVCVQKVGHTIYKFKHHLTALSLLFADKKSCRLIKKV